MNEQQLKLSRALRAKLAEAEITEWQLLAWLKQRGAIARGVCALQSIPLRHLVILLESWDDVLAKIIEEQGDPA